MKIPSIQSPFGQRSVVFSLFDLAVILTLAAALNKLLGNEVGVPSISMVPGSEFDHASAYANQTAAFKVGEVVEIHEPFNPYALVAQIDRVSIDFNGSIQYDLHAEVDGEIFRDVPSSTVWALGRYDFDTRAMCEYGKTPHYSGPELVPCIVKTSDGDRYIVQLEDNSNNGDIVYKTIPVSRIRRAIDPPAPEEVEEEETSRRRAAANYQEKSIAEDESHHLQLGGLVELQLPGSKFAVPASILFYFRETINLDIRDPKYDLKHEITERRIDDIDGEYLHPYEVYEYGTRCSCNIGTSDEIKMTSCIILSHSIDENRGGFLSYQVSYQNEAKMLVDEYLPYSRIQRRL